jgi:hypothetical protein
LSHIASAISELERQKEVIDRALSALRAIEVSTQTAVNNSNGLPRKKGRFSAEGRANIIAAAKKRWAERRAAQNGAPAKKTAPTKKTKKRVLSAEARKKMSLAAKKRWAAQKKKQAA